MLISNQKDGCLDYQDASTGIVYQDVAPLFYVQKVIRSIENPCGCDEWLIYVNDHNLRTYTFRISSAVIYQTSPLGELALFGLVIAPDWARPVCAHLVYTHGECVKTGAIEYRHTVLGWYSFNDVERYFYDVTDVDGTPSTTERAKLSFSKGDRDTYLAFLRKTVFPSVELSLALTIGYAAVVASRLRDEYDFGTILVNLCGISSTGKSTAEMLLCSPFMCPEISNKDTGLCFTANATQNAIFAKIDGIHGVPFVIDDITTNPNINLASFVYTLADGTPKSRCNGDGKLHDIGLGWSGVAVTSSEMPILDRADQHQGLKVRVLHTQGITWTQSAEEAEEVKRVVRKNYGFTGKEFAEFVQGIPMDELCERYEKSREAVERMMAKKDNLTERLSSRYAVFHLTAELLNAVFGYGISADAVTERFVRCEQETFDERDNATKAFDLVVDFVSSKGQHFDTEYHMEQHRHFGCTFATGERYGKIFKYDDRWEVHLFTKQTDKLLMENGLSELKWIRKQWVERGITKGDGDHNTQQKSYDGKRVRCDCFVIKGGITMPVLVPDPTPQAPTLPSVPADPPTLECTYDDSAAIEAIFGGSDEDQH